MACVSLLFELQRHESGSESSGGPHPIAAAKSLDAGEGKLAAGQNAASEALSPFLLCWPIATGHLNFEPQQPTDVHLSVRPTL